MLKPHSDIEIPEQARWLEVLWTRVPPTTLKKGREYADSRRVSELAAGENLIEGRVLGGSGQEYRVDIRRTDGGVDSTCSCPAWGK